MPVIGLLSSRSPAVDTAAATCGSIISRTEPGRSEPIRFPRYVRLNPQRGSSKSTLRARGLNRSSRIGLEDLSRPADARQQPSHDSVVRLAAAALKLVLLDGPFGEGRGLICRLSLVLRKRHPLANDFPARLVVFHVCGSLGCNFSTRPEATASFIASRNSSEKRGPSSRVLVIRFCRNEALILIPSPQPCVIWASRRNLASGPTLECQDCGERVALRPLIKLLQVPY